MIIVMVESGRLGRSAYGTFDTYPQAEAWATAHIRDPWEVLVLQPAKKGK